MWVTQPVSSPHCDQQRHQNSSRRVTDAMTDRGEIVAIALLTRSELRGVGDALRHVIRVEDGAEDFADLLVRIDNAESGRSDTDRH
jgi:hypothetical protein